MHVDRPLILASGSPRRRALLEKLHIDFRVVPSGVVEAFRKGESPRDHVVRLATDKAKTVAGQFPEHWVIGADTAVARRGKILGKPRTRVEACQMLSHLSGGEHEVLTGYAIAMNKEAVFVRDAVETKVRMKHLSPEEIKWYVGTGEPFGKAGAYAIQDIGCFMVTDIEGSYTNVVGLPVCQVVDWLRALGAIDVK